MWTQGGNNLLSGMVNGMIQFWTWLKKLPAIHLTNEGRCDRQKWKFNLNLTKHLLWTKIYFINTFGKMQTYDYSSGT